jgi:VWA domain-containing protein/aerotolerance regulator-like protein
MTFINPAAAAAFVAVPAIVALYFLKARGAEARVASLALWPRHLADRQANTPWKRLRVSRLLLVQLVVAAALAMALMRPGVERSAGAARTTVVLLDASPSMLATDVKPSRFEAAVSRARDLTGEVGAGRKMAVVLLGEHAQLLAPATDDKAALRAALRRARVTGAAADLEEGVSLANSILAGKPGGSVVLLSDGHFVPPASPPGLAAPLTYESIGSSGENAALEAVGRTPSGDVFLRVANLGTVPRDLRVELRADGRLVDVLPLRVEANSTVEPSWNGLPSGTAVLEARLAPDDDFPLDDAAWLVTGAQTARRVEVVTADNGFLTRAVRLRDDLDVTVVNPADYKPAPYDLYVFDGFVPPGPLPEPALVIAPPEGSGPVPVGPSIDPGALLPADPRDPLLENVSLRDVHVQAAARVTVPDGWRTVIAAANAPLLIVRKSDGRVAQLNFDIHRSDLPLRPAFPLLVQNLVSSLLPSSFENQVLPLGQPVRVIGSRDTTAVVITRPSGGPVTLRPPFPATLTDTSMPGVYNVEERRPAGSVKSTFVVELQDPRQSRIVPGDKPTVRAVSRTPGEKTRATMEMWKWLAALALAGVVIESVVFVRG